MRSLSIAMLGLFAASYAGVAMAATTWTVNVNDDPPFDPYNDQCPPTCSLRQAITHASIDGTDSIVFDPGVATPIRLSGGIPELFIDKALAIYGPGAGKLTISAQNGGRVLRLDSPSGTSGTTGIAVSIFGVTLADGLIDGVPGTDGGVDGNGNGVDGGHGENVHGGCVLVENHSTQSVALVMSQVAVRNCVARGGAGGNGGTGQDGACICKSGNCTPTVSPGSGGNGGLGGFAEGGAISILSGAALYLDHSSVIDSQVFGGAGGSGGSGGVPGCKGSASAVPGNGSLGGFAQGGAISLFYSTSTRIQNSTLAASSVIGGTGGAGATYPSGSNAGSGGDGTGGLLYSYDNSGSAAAPYFYFSTLANGSVQAGAAGAGTGGAPGQESGSAMAAAGFYHPVAASNIAMGVQPGIALCSGTVDAEAGSLNLSETEASSNCAGFALHATLAQTLRPLEANAALPSLMPVWHGAAIDAATSCQTLHASFSDDENDTPRPQGAKCDLGAIEADYIFVDGFGG